MANIADTVYRVYGSKETVKFIQDKLASGGMTLRDAIVALGYEEPAVTEELAREIVLHDDFTETGGTSYSNEHLDVFMMEFGIPFGSPLEKVNAVLEKSGIVTIHTDRFNMRGDINYVEAEDDYSYVNICSDNAWNQQDDFITALKIRFKDDSKFSVAFRCEEPGCDYYVSNVAGAIYGEYVSDLDCETENHETFEEMSAYVLEWLCKNAKGTSFPKCENFEELQEFCYNYNETNPDHPIFVHQFTILQ